MKTTDSRSILQEPLGYNPARSDYKNHIGVVVRSLNSDRLMLGTKEGWVVLDGEGIGTFDCSTRFSHRKISKITIAGVYADDYNCMR